jgi:hypothetical protein
VLRYRQVSGLSSAYAAEIVPRLRDVAAGVGGSGSEEVVRGVAGVCGGEEPDRAEGGC